MNSTKNAMRLINNAKNKLNTLKKKNWLFKTMSNAHSIFFLAEEDILNLSMKYLLDQI